MIDHVKLYDFYFTLCNANSADCSSMCVAVMVLNRKRTRHLVKRLAAVTDMNC